ncbi:universal stress protein, partial [Clavibacter michiganensis]|uniref:universal stress protein n=1 Tax=Clavibacter michiganensis TaxID=28447 RepID=UPI00292DCA78
QQAPTAADADAARKQPRQSQVHADPREIPRVTVLAVVSAYAAAPFANEPGPRRATGQTELSYRRDRVDCGLGVAAVFDGWGPTIHHDVRSGSPATAVIRAAEDLSAGLTSMAGGSRGLIATTLLGRPAS